MLRGIRKKASILSNSSQVLASSLSSENSAKYSKVLKQVHDFEIALEAMDLLLDDRGEEGINLLNKELKSSKAASKDPAAIFSLALGVMEFIEATLGFETEVMNKAHKTLSNAEEASLAHSKFNQKKQLATSHIYPPGTEFQVTYAELTLLNALVMLLQEDNGMMEQAKALFKLRRAYQILDSTYKKIKESEGVFNRNLAKFREEAENASVSSADLPGYSIPDREAFSSTLPEDIQLMKNLEEVYQMRKKRVEGTNLGPHASQVNLFKNESTLSVALSSLSCSPYLERVSTPMGRTVSPNPQNVAANAAFLKEERSAKCEEPSSESDDDEDSEEDKFSDASETFDSACGSPNFASAANSGSVTPSIQQYPASIVSISTPTSSVTSGNDTHLHVSTIDEFIHSGVQLCFGILQVVLSLIPPAIGKVLSIVGFKGDRDIGLRMLWRTAITARNIHGELALLCLLVFYDGPIQFIDVGFQLPGHEDNNVTNVLSLNGRSTVSDKELTDIIKNPNLYTPQLLSKARSFFPHNALWLLQEGRMHAAQGDIHKSIELMQNFTDDPNTSIQMEQVEALLTYDRAIFYAFCHDYDKAARDFIRMTDISSWSQAVYLFMAGVCFLEKWRMMIMGEIKYTDEVSKNKDMEFYAQKAEKYLKLAPTYVPGHGVNAAKKRGGIGGSNKQMPFDKFVLRKTRQIEERQRKYPELQYIECVGTSLVHELAYFWNGYNRMLQEDLELLHRMLEFSASSYAKFPESQDEAMIRHLFQSLALRQLGKPAEGVTILDIEVTSKYVLNDLVPFKFTKMTYSPYLYPTALYERAMFTWVMKSKNDAKLAIDETVKWLEKAEIVSDIGDYELSNRTSMRIKAATERLEQLRNEV